MACSKCGQTEIIVNTSYNKNERSQCGCNSLPLTSFLTKIETENLLKNFGDQTQLAKSVDELQFNNLITDDKHLTGAVDELKADEKKFYAISPIMDEINTLTTEQIRKILSLAVIAI